MSVVVPLVFTRHPTCKKSKIIVKRTKLGRNGTCYFPRGQAFFKALSLNMCFHIGTNWIGFGSHENLNFTCHPLDLGFDLDSL